MEKNNLPFDHVEYWGYLYNHKHICEALLWEGVEVANLLFRQHVQAISSKIDSDEFYSDEIAYITLNSLNRNLYSYIQFYLNISLHECCYMCRVHSHAITDKDSLIIAGEHIIESYAACLNCDSERYRLFHQSCIYMQNHLGEDISIAKICDNLHISRSYLCRMFKELTGNSVIEYLKQQRIYRARTLLRSTDLSVEDIASKCGFQSSAYFSTVFKREMGISPSVFRKNYIKNSDSGHAVTCTDNHGMEVYMRGVMDGARLHYAIVSRELPYQPDEQ